MLPEYTVSDPTHLDQSRVALIEKREEKKTAPNQESAPAVHFKEPALRAKMVATDTILLCTVVIKNAPIGPVHSIG